MPESKKGDRRQFLKTGSALIAAATLPKVNLSASPLLPAFSESNPESFWKSMRLQFPLQAKPVFLNNGTMGPSPYPVIEAVKKSMDDVDQHAAYGGWESCAAKIAQFVGADEQEIALTHNVTEGINIACWGVPLKKGDEVILCSHEHAGNAIPWLQRRKLDGIVIQVIDPAPTADEFLEKLKKRISPKTKAIAFPHIPCTTGQIFPMKEICALAREKGIFSLVDGAHGMGMIPLNLHEMGCDTYASCGHKWLLGPKGTGFIYVRKEFQAQMKATFVGAGSDKGEWNMAVNPPIQGAMQSSAHLFYSGTQNLSLYRGLEAAIDFFNTVGPDRIYARIAELGHYAQEQLLSLGSGIELLTPRESQSKAGVNGFRLIGTDAQKVYNYCAEKGYKIRVVHENKLNSLRVSTHIYNSKEEVDGLIGVLKEYREKKE
ncbi:aminotransferase class V-fold PLP-dependent enzyme [Bacteroidota bacterium]